MQKTKFIFDTFAEAQSCINSFNLIIREPFGQRQGKWSYKSLKQLKTAFNQGLWPIYDDELKKLVDRLLKRIQ